MVMPSELSGQYVNRVFDPRVKNVKNVVPVCLPASSAAAKPQHAQILLFNGTSSFQST